jgi:hypothetical protein
MIEPESSQDDLLPADEAREAALRNHYLETHGKEPDIYDLNAYRLSFLSPDQIGNRLKIPPSGKFFAKLVEQADVEPRITFRYQHPASPTPGRGRLYDMNDMPRLKEALESFSPPEGVIAVEAARKRFRLSHELFRRMLREHEVETELYRDPDTGLVEEYTYPQRLRSLVLDLIRKRA